MAFEEHKPTIFMFLLQVMYAGMTLVTRASLVNGLSPRVFVVYRQAMAASIMAPIAFLTRRKSKNCQLKWKSFWMIFLISLIGVTINQNIYFEGLYLTSSSIASAMGNLLPAITFVVAYATGFEKIKIPSLRSLAKIIGTIICVAGALGMAMLKGPKLLSQELPLMPSLFSKGGEPNWLLGCVLLLGGNICWSIWLIMQVPVSKCYPDHLSLTAWMCFIAALQSAVVALLVEPDLEAWKLESYEDLGCCFFTAAGSAISFFTQAWCISKRGPLFSAMFNPMSTVMVTVTACLFLHEEMYAGSLAGALAVMFGLYIVLWGKAKDQEESIELEKNLKQATPIDESSGIITSCRIDLEEPLLTSKSVGLKEDQIRQIS